MADDVIRMLNLYSGFPTNVRRSSKVILYLHILDVNNATYSFTVTSFWEDTVLCLLVYIFFHEIEF